MCLCLCVCGLVHGRSCNQRFRLVGSNFYLYIRARTVRQNQGDLRTGLASPDGGMVRRLRSICKMLPTPVAMHRVFAKLRMPSLKLCVVSARPQAAAIRVMEMAFVPVDLQSVVARRLSVVCLSSEESRCTTERAFCIVRHSVSARVGDAIVGGVDRARIRIPPGVGDAGAQERRRVRAQQ